MNVNTNEITCCDSVVYKQHFDLVLCKYDIMAMLCDENKHLHYEYTSPNIWNTAAGTMFASSQNVR